MIRYEGAFRLEGMGLGGWAREKGNPAPLWLEIIVDGSVLDVVCADLEEPEGCGFWLALPPAVLEDGTELMVRVANTSVYLGDAISLAKAENFPALQGEFSVDRGLVLSGWALDSAAPGQPLKITALVDKEALKETLACERRYFPKLGDGHGFTLHLPLSLADGEEHLIAVQDTQKKRNLPGSPFIIRLWPHHLADWLEQTPKMSLQKRELMCRCLRSLESRLPGACAATEDDYTAWKAAFPVPKPQGKVRLSLTIPFCEARQSAAHIRSQKGVEIHSNLHSAHYALLLGEGEKLHPYALAHLLAAQRATGAGLVYADSEQNKLPYFRPAWDADLFWATDYLGPFLVSGEVLDATRPAEGESYWSFRLRLAQNASRMGGIRHLPLLLSSSLPQPKENGRWDALQSWVADLNVRARVGEASGCLRIHWPRTMQPEVTVIIPTRNRADLLLACLTSLHTTSYPALKILVVDNGSTDEEAKNLLAQASEDANTSVISHPGPFQLCGSQQPCCPKSFF